MSILVYIVRTRIKNAFGRGTGVWMTAGGVFAGIFAVLYGLGFGFLAWESVSNVEVQREFDIRGMLTGVIVGMAVFGMMKDFVPSYKRRPNLVPALAPLSPFGRWVVNQASCYLNLFVLAFLLFGASFAVFGLRAPEGGMWLGMLVAVVFISETASFTLRTAFEFEVPGRSLWMVLPVILAAAVPVAAGFWGAGTPAWLLATALLASLGVSFAADSRNRGLRMARLAVNDAITMDQALVRMVFRNDMVRRMLLLGLVFKVVMGGFLYFQINLNDRPNSFLIWEFKLIFLSPVLVFTYVYGNTWAFFGQIFLALQRIRPATQPLLRHYVKLLALPLGLDLSFSFLGALLIGIDPLETLGLMVASTALCIAGGFAASMFLPKRLDPAATMRRSQIHTGASLGIILVLVVFCVGFAFDATRWWFVAGSVLVSALSLWLTLHLAESKVEGVIQKVI